MHQLVDLKIRQIHHHFPLSTYARERERDREREEDTDRL